MSLYPNADQVARTMELTGFDGIQARNNLIGQQHLRDINAREHAKRVADGVARISTADKLQTLADLLALASKLAADISSTTDVAGLHYLTKVEAQNLARSARGYEAARQNILRGDSL